MNRPPARCTCRIDIAVNGFHQIGQTVESTVQCREMNGSETLDANKGIVVGSSSSTLTSLP